MRSVSAADDRDARPGEIDGPYWAYLALDPFFKKLRNFFSELWLNIWK